MVSSSSVISNSFKISGLFQFTLLLTFRTDILVLQKFTVEPLETPGIVTVLVLLGLARLGAPPNEAPIYVLKNPLETN